jgi:hypothetical protein
MQLIKRIYRKDYAGEDIITTLTHEQQEWVATKEFIPNQIANLQTSNRALIIGNGITRQEFNMRYIAEHKGGLRGRNRLQTYGCNALYRDFTPDFLIATGDKIVNEIAESGYCDSHVVYGNTWAIATYPRQFYLIPQDPAWNAGTLATYLACFDGHKKIFLMGFDGQETDEWNNNIYAGTNGYDGRRDSTSEDYWVRSMSLVFKTYPEVEFVRVAPTQSWRMPELWKYATNLRSVDWRGFTIEADL